MKFMKGIIIEPLRKLIDNIPFKTTLEYIGFVRGRSALNIQWKDLNSNTLYYSGMTLLDEALNNKKNKRRWFY